MGLPEIIARTSSDVAGAVATTATAAYALLVSKVGVASAIS